MEEGKITKIIDDVFFLHKAMAAVICGIVVFTATVLCRRYRITGVAGGAFIFLQYRMSILDIFRMDQWKYLNVFSVFWQRIFCRDSAVSICSAIPSI